MCVVSLREEVMKRDESVSRRVCLLSLSVCVCVCVCAVVVGGPRDN